MHLTKTSIFLLDRNLSFFLAMNLQDFYFGPFFALKPHGIQVSYFNIRLVDFNGNITR